MVFLSAENITGNWDPTAHTTLSQKNIEGFVMGFLTRTPMTLEDPGAVVYELATSIELLDPHRLQIKLRDDVQFHDGKPFLAEDVKATFEYGSQPDRPAQWYPGPTETLTIETPDEHTVIVDTSKGGYPAHLFMFLASFLPMMSAKDIAGGPGGPCRSGSTARAPSASWSSAATIQCSRLSTATSRASRRSRRSTSPSSAIQPRACCR